MRDVIFRGKRVDNGEWVEGFFVERIDRLALIPKCYILVQEEDTSGITGEPTGYLNTEFSWYEVIPETVGQYTGLTDKNGKMVFEGDVIFCKKHIDGNFVDAFIEFGFVEMKYGAFGLHRRQGFYRPFKDWLEDYELEVIGNIHDNKEILDVE